ncbi:D-alanine--D-alanine ligase family protein [Desulfotalea psychrophila]|uniref:D-alanine--D-alanine ligase n=1 Tax=Desulfotalea psychrophila (strain LSv54 / DSM 12343) TaxID=177439 RepID=DDL_DESPS|nr:D-alanine--D-alanine ligase [Desulfotalea psychrophila]Q6ASD8.1 RecName: Full=D-alanine--D-alanine ligase; AltName: Full=D-Ala-D-Ala ligase; AltName: Full=D-alanylalanine synthetase [Desulfotalea psychrophila LSv54]CAG34787.1 probable D-alanyl-D-alanine ligase [Desulfotalea psychrophila LSv54]
MQEQRAERLRIALIAGGTSGEREVSLTGADGVERILDKEKYLVSRYDSATDLPRLAADAASIDFAFILLHGLHGEDGTIQGFLDLLGIPYQGSGVLGSALAMDKDLAKEFYYNAELPVADWHTIAAGDFFYSEELIEDLGLPLVVKPACAGSSIGISLAHTEEELLAGINHARDCSAGAIMVEQFIKGRELTCAVLGNDDLQALPVLEIVPGDKYAFFDYEAKYQPGASEEICPALIADALREQVQDHAIRAHQALRLRGYSRTDFIYGEDGKLYLLETNTIPGMTETSILPQEAAATGMDFPSLLDTLIELGLEKSKGKKG